MTTSTRPPIWIKPAFNLHSARPACEHVNSKSVRVALEDRLLAVLDAVGTKVVHRLHSTHRFLARVSERSTGKFYELVPLLLTFPVFELSQLAFKLVYPIGALRLRRLGRQHPGIGIDEHALQLQRLAAESLRIPDPDQGLRYFRRGLERIQSDPDCCHVNHTTSPSNLSDSASPAEEES